MKALKLLPILILIFSCTGMFAQNGTLWKARTPEAKAPNRAASYEVSKRKIYELDMAGLRKRLKNAPLRQTGNKSGIALDFPMADGRKESFQVYETPLLNAALSRRHPGIRSYTGRSPENPSRIIKFTLTVFGFHGMILTPGETVVYINPEDKEAQRYEVFSRSDLSPKAFECQVQEMEDVLLKDTEALKINTVNDGNLRTFRLALAATAEYTQFHANAAGVGTGTDEEKRNAALAAMTVTMARVNGIFESEMGITMELVPNESIIFLDPDTDGLTNNNGGSLINEIQPIINSNIGTANYDIGHVFSTDGGGIAQLNSPCTSNKARGVTGLPTPVGDPFDVDFVAHEMGHQYGATHTFNNSCGGNRSTITSVEPGSGTTIMSYAGICPPNLQSNVDPYFHAVSIQQMWQNITAGNSTCAALTLTGNTAPMANAGADYTIPASTPFVLEGQGTDADGDMLTYCWEQTDTEVAIQPPSANTPGGPLFRSLAPVLLPDRYFPALPNILAGNLSTVWEVLPAVSRELRFSLMVRDNNPAGGQTARDDITVTVAENSGPFAVISQAGPETWEAGEVHTVTWDVAGTDTAPVNADLVTIILYTDTQFENAVVLSDNVVNDGSHNVVVPGGIDTTTGRIMVRPVNNIFFAVNAANITITQSEYVLNFASLDQTACQPGDAVFNFNYNTYLGFSDMTGFTAVGVPAGLAVNFNPPSATSDDTQVDVTVSNTGGVAEGDYTFTIRATSGAFVKDYEIALAVYNASFNDPVLTEPADMATGVVLQPQLQWETVAFAEHYQIEISEMPDFLTVIESAVIRQTDYTPAVLQDNTTYYWRIKPLNSCGEGTFGNAFSFTTTPVDCKTFSNTNVVPISESGTPSVMASVVIVDDLPVNSVSVSTNITHTWVEDLRATLTSPAGTVVNLFSNLCGSGHDIDVTFDDTGAALSCNPSPPVISGTVRPEQQLSAFAGESAQGEWVLTVYDDANLDGGSLNAFSINVCVNGEFPPDSDSDGVTDVNDLCPGTPAGTTVDVNGCPVFSLPADNFTIAITGESCIANNDGSISISANQPLNYQAALTGNGVDTSLAFTAGADFPDLSAGTYTLCITVDTAPGYEQCYDINVVEPQPLAVQTKVNNAEKTVTVEMSGAAFYNVELNGITTQTTDDSLTLALQTGINTLKVTTDKACQGSYEKEIRIGDIAVYPNPVVNAELTIALTNPSEENVTVRIYALTGKLIYATVFETVTAPVHIDVSGLPSGVYLLNVSGSHTKTTQKIVKL